MWRDALLSKIIWITLNAIEKNSRLFCFVPFIDENEIKRLGRKLIFGDIFIEEKNPITLPGHFLLKVWIIGRDYEKMMQARTAYTLTRIPCRYSIPKGRQLVKSHIKYASSVQKNSIPLDQIESPLSQRWCEWSSIVIDIWIRYCGTYLCEKDLENSKQLNYFAHLQIYLSIKYSTRYQYENRIFSPCF